MLSLNEVLPGEIYCWQKVSGERSSGSGLLCELMTPIVQLTMHKFNQYLHLIG